MTQTQPPVIYAEPTTYDALADALARRREERNISFAALGEVAGLVPGFVAGALGPSHSRTLGWEGTLLLLPLLALRIVLVEDEAAAAKYLDRLSGRKSNQARLANFASKPSKRVKSRVQRYLAVNGGRARARKMTAEERSESARHAATKRWVKPRVRELKGRAARRVREQIANAAKVCENSGL